MTAEQGKSSIFTRRIQVNNYEYYIAIFINNLRLFLNILISQYLRVLQQPLTDSNPSNPFKSPSTIHLGIFRSPQSAPTDFVEEPKMIRAEGKKGNPTKVGATGPRPPRSQRGIRSVLTCIMRDGSIVYKEGNSFGAIPGFMIRYPSFRETSPPRRSVAMTKSELTQRLARQFPGIRREE